MNRMVSSCTGQIQQIAFARTGSQIVSSPLELLEMEYADLLRTLPHTCELVWIGLFANGLNGSEFHALGRKVICVSVSDPMPKGLGFMERWIRDHFICRHDVDGTTLVLPRQQSVGIDLVSDALSRTLPIRLQRSQLAFEGGNLLRSGNRLFAGYDIAVHNHLDATGKSWAGSMQKTEGYLMSLTGTQEVIWIGSHLPFPVGGRSFGQSQGTHQPFYHIDLFLTPVGTNSRGEEEVLMADPRLLFAPSPQEVALLTEIRHALFRIEESLVARNLVVHRLPMGILNAPAQWRLLSYNNCLVECVPGKRRLYLPDYHSVIKAFGTAQNKEEAVALLQQEVRQKLGSLGIHSQWLEMNYDLKKLGALHCLTQVLRRN